MFDVVIPTVGRASLNPLLDSLTRALPAATRVYVVDDRATGAAAAELPVPDDPRVTVLRSGGRGPAAARNVGWHASRALWIAFVDDDVDVPLGWVPALEADLVGVPGDVAAVQGRIHVPLPAGRRPVDWERNVQGLEQARWVTADLAVRREALEDIDGFEERFPRAYREDSDLALRLLARDWRLEMGERWVRHPARRAPWWVSVKLQRGNADDVMIEHLHGREWRRRIDAPVGTFASHRTTVLVGAAGLATRLAGRRGLSRLLSGWWLARSLRFAWKRIAPGPRTPGEVAAMTATSLLIPPAAVFNRLRGHLRVARLGGAVSRGGR